MATHRLEELAALVHDDDILLGAAEAAPYDQAEAALADRVARGLWADMRFTAARPEVSCHPERAVRGARTVISALLPIWEPATPRPAGPVGRLPRYAWEDPYTTLRTALGRVRDTLKTAGHRSVVHVDANHHIDREGARRAGLTFGGKNTMAIAPGLGSFVAIGTLITDAPIDHEPLDPVRQGCGSCTLCIDACPTGALDEPYVLDAERCLSYWTQSRRSVPDAIADALEDRVYGCDICQDVCPYNHGPAERRSTRPPSAAGWVRLDEWIAHDPAKLLERYARLYVPDLDGRYLVRNALIALGNDDTADRELARSIAEGDDPLLAPVARRALAR
jgi:epoxyqueuosine reductase